jgi:hypothetical protein
MQAAAGGNARRHPLASSDRPSAGMRSIDQVSIDNVSGLTQDRTSASAERFGGLAVALAKAVSSAMERRREIKTSCDAAWLDGNR